MAECGQAPEYDEEAEIERDRAARIENYYQQSAWELAERVVDLEDELGANVDGICTGMHADVAEAHAEVERLTTELEASKRDADLGWEHASAADNDAAEWERLWKRTMEWGTWRRLAWLSARGRATEYGKYYRSYRAAYEQERASSLRRWNWLVKAIKQRDRYRSAWLSARRRAADEANMGAEAVDHLRRDRDRWRSGHETAEAQLVYERRENARLRAELDARN
jgi:hypothetical protein